MCWSLNASGVYICVEQTPTGGCINGKNCNYYQCIILSMGKKNTDTLYFIKDCLYS
jgi:hypothetical protein